ncbi:MAG TPA: hypothetical protein VIY51_07705 [Xanthobacteraceae bacterium]
MKFRFGAVLLCLLLSAPARAHEVEVGTTIICDTQRQVERFVSLMHGNAQSAVSTVNAEEKNQSACGMSKLAFVRGLSLAMVRTKDQTFEIVEILVVGVASEAGVQAVVPNVQFAVFKVEEKSA